MGKLSVEIVGKEHDMNYKRSCGISGSTPLVPELLDKVDTKQMGFMPAVEILVYQAGKPAADCRFH